MVDRESFARYVKDALLGFYDPVHLQTNPLADLLVPLRTADETRAQALRQILREAIEALRPAASVPLGRPEWLGYRLLWLRYVQSVSQFDASEQLGLSRASYYRRHQEAIDALVSILWEKHEHGTPAEETEAVPPADASLDDQARTEASRLVRTSRPAVVSLGELLAGVWQTIEPLARAQGIALRETIPPTLPETYGDPGILRQILLSVLTEAMDLAAGSAVYMVATVKPTETVWQVSGLDETKVSSRGPEHLTGFAVSRELLKLYGGQLRVQRHGVGAPAIVLTLPTARPKDILIIDDDMDAIRLYQRYLQVQDYVVHEAHTGEQLHAVLAEHRPDLILLDVLMPREDGWGVLERLKRTPETASIPVVICSVLDQPRLALALGAEEVLRKPFSEELLLKTVQAVLKKAGTMAPTSPSEPAGNPQP